MFVYEGEPPRSDSDAPATYAALIDRYQHGEHVEPTAAIRAYVEALVARWPDTLEDSDDSPWASAPLIEDASGPMLHCALVNSGLDESVSFMAAEAERRGLVCIDPQGPPFLLAPKRR